MYVNLTIRLTLVKRFAKLHEVTESITRLGAASTDETTSTLAMGFATSIEFEIMATNIAPLDLTTATTASVDSSNDATAGALSSETTATELSASTATTTASHSVSQQFKTFFLSSAVSGTVSLYLPSAQLAGSLIGWNIAKSIVGERLSFNIEAGTNYAVEVSECYSVIMCQIRHGKPHPNYARCKPWRT